MIETKEVTMLKLNNLLIDLQKLRNLQLTDRFNSLKDEEKDLLVEQTELTTQLCEVLSKRLKL